MEKNTVQTSLLIKNADITITSVASFRNFIFVSAYGDKLLIYTIRKENDTTSISEPRVYENYFNTKYAADELIVDPIHELLLCRTVNGVYCVDINDLSKKTLLANTEKCTCMALKMDCSKLCIGIRKKTLVFSLLSNKTGYKFVNYIPSKETPLCMDWLGDSLFVGCKIAYYLQDVDSFSITKTVLTKCTKSSTSLLSIATSMNSEVILLDTDNTLRIFDKQGIPTHSEDDLIRITTQPSQLISLFPYLFVIVKNYIYVYNLVSLNRIQRIPLEGKFHLVANPDGGDSFLLHSLHNIYSLSLLSPEDQIKILLSTQPPSFEQAISVATNHDLSVVIKKELHCCYGYYLFSQSLFDEAMNHFLLSKCDIHNVLQLFKELHLPSLVIESLIKNEFSLPTFSPVTRRRAYEALIQYLLSIRKNLLASLPASSSLIDSSSSSIDATFSIQQDLLCIVDTSLVYTWICLQAGDDLKSFLLNKNYCNIQLVEERLVESIQSSMTEKSRSLFSFTLLYLFEGKHQFKRAVEVILFQMRYYQTPSPERTLLLEILTNVLYGLDATDESLVFKCSEKIYEEQPSLVIHCFVDKDGMIGHLNIYHVVQHLQHLTEKETTVYKRNQLAIEYLQTVVPHFSSFSTNDVNYNLAQLLISLYIESIKELMKNTDEESISICSSLQQQLQLLLKENSSYQPAGILELLPNDSLLYERCLVYSRLHKHDKALHLLLYQLEDMKGAYDYCEGVYKRCNNEDKRVFIIMLQLLLNPPEEVNDEKKEELKKEAFHLIDSYHSCIDPEEVITVFPDTTSFPDLFHYTLQAITELTEQMYNTRMKCNLTMSDYMESQHHVAKTRQNGVEVNETSICSKCGKPLGTAAVVWTNENELYHYSCCEVEGDSLIIRDQQTGMIEKIPISHSSI